VGQSSTQAAGRLLRPRQRLACRHRDDMHAHACLSRLLPVCAILPMCLKTNSAYKCTPSGAW
jgi:hypothetical protein